MTPGTAPAAAGDFRRPRWPGAGRGRQLRAARMRRTFSGSTNMALFMGVRIMPGATAFTRIPCDANSSAIKSVMPDTPNFEAT